MGQYRLKVKLGEFEFDAEGDDQAALEAQFRAFQEMVGSLPSPSRAAIEATTPEPAPTVQPTEAVADQNLNRIMKSEGRVISLTAPPTDVVEAVLLVMYGQRILRNNETPTGSEVIDGIKATGGLDMGRTERLFQRIASTGDIVLLGEGRGKRYRLTNTGINRVRQIAARLIATVA